MPEVIGPFNGSFGKVWQLREGNVILDSYAPWNGDPRPDWMTDEALAAPFVDIGGLA